MNRSLRQRLFVQHPNSIGQSYRQHLASSSSLALELLRAGAAALVHGLLPFLFASTASTAIYGLYDRMVEADDDDDDRFEPTRPEGLEVQGGA